MGTHHGKAGSVKIGTDAVLEVTQFTLKEEADLAEVTVMGDASKTYLVGTKGWDGSISCFWDETDSTGQEALTVGATVALKLYPEGSGTGAKYYYGNAIVKDVSIGVPKDGVVTREFSFTGNGDLTLGTAS